MLRNTKILVVEDESILAMYLKSILEELGYAVSAQAASGEAAIERAVELHPDLVLMDIVLKGEMDGIQAAEHIQGKLDIPVIYLTAYADEETLLRARVTEPFGYLLKPFEKRELRTAIEMALYKHQMERRLKESEGRFRALTSAALDAIIVINNEGDISYWNTAAEQIFGYSGQEVIGKNLQALIVPERYHQAYRQGFSRFRETGRGAAVGTTLELAALRRDGSEFPVEISLSSVQIKGEWHGVGIVRDITERKRAEEALRERTHMLGERVKELNCLYGISKLLEESGITLEEIFRRIVELIPPSCPYPEFTCARMIVEGRSFTTPNFKETQWRQASDITAYGEPIGVVEIYYLEERPESVERPFLKEERDLINAIADRMGRSVERLRMEKELKLNARVFDIATDGIIITDTQANIITVNKAFTTITGYDLSDVVGKNPRLLQSGRHTVDFYWAMWETLKGTGQWQSEIWNRHKNGSIYPQWLSINAVESENGTITNYIGVFTDITVRKETEEYLQHVATHDPLTGLANRILFQDKLNHALSLAKRNKSQLAVLFLDLDGFKSVNDTFGHEKGDLLLQKIAEKMERCVRESDTVARLAGDEFTIILESISIEEDAAKVAGKILTTMSEPMPLPGFEVMVTSSIGISLFPQDGDNAEDLLRSADTAMYQAKQAGKNNYKFA